ncbi:MAG: type II secretion system protein GspN [Deltaproteobacteria bacterium]|nr:type II secretion system protein GspN [Deltaproteobacteria bacterium]
MQNTGTGLTSNRRTILGMVLAAALIVFGLLLFSLTAFHIVPLGIIEDRLKAGLGEKGLHLSEESLTRSFPFGLKAQNVALSASATGKQVIRFDEAQAWLALADLLRGDFKIALRARVGNGLITGDLSPGFNGALLNLEAVGMEFKDIPALTNAGINSNGSFNGTVTLYMAGGACPSGTIRLRGGHISEESVRFAGLKLPVGDIDDAGLNAEIRDCKALIEGLWLDGRGLSAKLTGEVFIKTPFETSQLNMTLEVTPKGDLTGKAWMLAFINAFRKASNYYSVHIGGTVANPVAGR